MRAGLEGVAVVACEALAFIDVTCLRTLLNFVRSLDGFGIALFGYSWQPQPHRLLDLIDAPHPAMAATGTAAAPPSH